MKPKIILLIIFLNGCSQAPEPLTTKLENHIATELKGIWIPKIINWTSGDFDTYYFPNDSSVIIISSAQRKTGDSIYFNVEEGFNIKKGALLPSLDSNILIKAHTIYRFIKMTDSIGNEIKSDTTIVLELPKGSTKSIQLNGLSYIPAVQYTQESRRNVINIATKMVPSIDKNK
jgi:hypothetical protein